MQGMREREKPRMTSIFLSEQLKDISCHLSRYKGPQKESFWDEVGVKKGVWFKTLSLQSLLDIQGVL